MNLFKYYDKPGELIYGDKEDSIPIIVWDKYARLGELEKHKLILAKDPTTAFDYAEIMDRLFPEGEDAIAKNAMYSYYYCINYMNNKFSSKKNRFYKGEDAISKHPSWSYHYAKQIIQGCWPEAEEAIKRNKSYYNDYVNRVCKS